MTSRTDKLQAVIFDWAGTTVDHGSLAPIRAILELFATEDMEVSDAEARLDMGLLKKDHLRKILGIPRVSEMWKECRGAQPVEQDVERLFVKFVPLQMAALEEHSRPIDGIVPMIHRLRARGLKVGSTTGYTREMLNVVLSSASAQGYSPDYAGCPDDVGAGRPYPWMCYYNAIRLRVYPLANMVKIGDTPSDIEEGRNAGMWTVAVARTGNAIGLSEADYDALPANEKTLRMSHAHATLAATGAHYVIDSAADCEPVLDQIEERLRGGERP